MTVLIAEYGDKDVYMPTSKDVAKLAGVSRATVSNVLSGAKYVSPELVKKVEDAVRKLNYRPHGIARSLVSKKTFSIGVLVPRINSSFYPPMISAIENKFSEAGYSTILCESAENPENEFEMLRVLSEKRVDGLIWVPSGEKNIGFVRSIDASGTPVIVLDRRLRGLDFDTVISDNRTAGKIATEHLIGLGNSKILIITFPTSHAPSQQRVEGYKAALKKAGLPVEESKILIVEEPEAENASRVLKKVFSEKEYPQAIFACTDLLTLAVLREATAAGIAIPEEMALIGFDDSPWGAFIQPPLTVITQDAQSLGSKAAGLLFDRIQGTRNDRPEEFIIPVKLIVRNSCGEKGNIRD